MNLQILVVLLAVVVGAMARIHPHPPMMDEMAEGMGEMEPEERMEMRCDDEWCGAESGGGRFRADEKDKTTASTPTGPTTTQKSGGDDQPAQQPAVEGVGQPAGQPAGPGQEGEKKKTCKQDNACDKDEECGGLGFGSCLATGLPLGTCNCNKCVQFAPCGTDAAKALEGQGPPCGGLEGACDAEKKQCDCTQGYKKAGFKDHVDALLNFCNKRQCKTDKDCNGLTCNAKKCSCVVKQP